MDVAVVGLGKMGEPIARRLLAAGHRLTVYNRSAGRDASLVEGGARSVSAPAEVWPAEMAITMVADDAALRDVTLGKQGLLLLAPPGAVLADMSTVSVGVSCEVAAAAEAAGVAYLRAPVTGNPSVVEAGNLGIIVSGDEATFARVEPLLRDIGSNVFHVGEEEQARVLKLALNLMIAGTAQLMAEAVVLAQAHGLDPRRTLEVMGASAVGSPFVKYKSAALVAGDYTPTFSSNAMYKDLALALGAGHDGGVPLPVTSLLQQLVQGCISSGWAEADLMTLVPRLRRESGLA